MKIYFISIAMSCVAGWIVSNLSDMTYDYASYEPEQNLTSFEYPSLETPAQ